MVLNVPCDKDGPSESCMRDRSVPPSPAVQAGGPASSVPMTAVRRAVWPPSASHPTIHRQAQWQMPRAARPPPDAYRATRPALPSSLPGRFHRAASKPAPLCPVGAQTIQATPFRCGRPPFCIETPQNNAQDTRAPVRHRRLLLWPGSRCGPASPAFRGGYTKVGLLRSQALTSQMSENLEVMSNFANIDCALYEKSYGRLGLRPPFQSLRHLFCANNHQSSAHSEMAFIVQPTTQGVGEKCTPCTGQFLSDRSGMPAPRNQIESSALGRPRDSGWCMTGDFETICNRAWPPRRVSESSQPGS